MTKPTNGNPGRCHPLLRGRDRTIWHADLVGKVPRYPVTQEAFDRRFTTLMANAVAAREGGRLNRKGIPNGWAGRRSEVVALAAEAERAAQRAAINLRNMEGDPQQHGPAAAVTDDERAELAMTAGIAIVLNPSNAASVRLAAARIVMPFLRPAPAGEAVDLKLSLDFLADLAGAGEGKDATPSPTLGGPQDNPAET